MKTKKIIIVGMGSAATGAASAIQFTNPKAEITFIEKRDYESYSPCGMPFAFEGKLKFEELKHAFPSKGSKSEIYLNTEAKKVDTEKKELLIENNDGEKILKYDSLIIATGVKPSIPPIKNIEKFSATFGVHLPNNLENVSMMYAVISPLSKVAIVGAGAIGLEFAAAINKLGIDPLVAEMLPQAFPNVIDKDMARHVHEYLKEKGVKILTESKVESLNGKEKLESIIINGKEYEIDDVVLCCGTKPNIDWIKDSGISYNENGIITDKRMKTNAKDVYAIGDCVETHNALTKKRCRSGLAVPARKQGRVAGINAAGKKATYQGTLNTFISVLDDYAIAATGLTAEQAKEESYELLMQKGKGYNKPEWYHGHKELVIKLIADKKGKLLGGQAFGEKYAVKSKIDTISAYLSKNSNIKDMMDGELAYCPDVADIPDPLTIALDFMLRRLKR